MSAEDIFGAYGDEGGDSWISVSDMMAGLMVIFLFIAILFIKDVLKENYRMGQVAELWENAQDQLYARLEEEFRNDLPRWNAELDRESLSVRFQEPSILFDLGEATVKPAFAEILDDFFPRYVKILDDFRDYIDEIRIEGHTSSEWHLGVSEEEAYFKNMQLSQDRTRAVLEHCLLLPSVHKLKDWIRSMVTANGLSSSRLVVVGGVEDPQRSRRVEFRVRTNADAQIRKILERTS